MARIPESTLSALKQSISLLELVRRQGYEPKRHGKDWVMACPFHADDTPSLVITERNNLWHCMGACQEGGSVIDWVMRSEGVSFRHACELLRSDTSFSRSASGTPVKRTTTCKLDAQLTPDADEQVLLGQVIDFYHETLLASTEAQDYLKSRSLDHPDLIRTFKLGYANRTLGYRLPKNNRVAGKEIRSQLQSIGILRSSGHEHFSGSLVIPVLGSNGEILEVYGRKVLGKRLRKGTPQHLYLPGPHAGVWNEAGLVGHHEVVLCEALIDAMSFWCAGITNVTASYGTSGFTAEHLAAFKELGLERVLIAYDRDAAGNKAAEKLARVLAKEGITPYRVLLPKGMDANEYALKVTPAAKSLGLVIRQAEQLALPKLSSGQASVESGPVTKSPEEKPESMQPATELPVTESSSLAADPDGPDAIDHRSNDRPMAVPPVPAERIAKVDDHEITFTCDARFYRVRGLERNRSDDQLKINLLLRQGDELHVDVVDLYVAKARSNFIRQGAAALNVDESLLKRDLGVVLRELELVRAEQQQSRQPVVPEMTPAERQAALEYLSDPKLMSRMVTDLEACGLVGEASNKQVAYLGCVSRLLSKPLAILVQSHSAAGKSALLEAVLAMVPEEHRMVFSAMSGQSLFYMNEGQLQHKVLAIAEEEGVRQASYALKLLQSQGGLVMASTGKDPNTGKLTTEEYRVEGPVMLFLTTTAIDLDEELRNRCLVLTVDEGREQTRQIHRLQRNQRTLAGLISKQQASTIQTLHHNAQRLLRPLPVVNPYADQLTFVDDQMRTRRDHEKYLTLIDVIALLHQYQRPLKSLEHGGERLEYIEVSRSDIELANGLAHEVLGRSLDELPPQTRRLLGEVRHYVETQCQAESIARSAYRFSRRDLRGLGWSYDQLRVHLARLVEMEYVLVHRGGRGQRFVYELLFDGELEQHDPQLIGLIQPDLLKPTMSDLGGSKPNNGASLGPYRGMVGAPSGSDQMPAKPVAMRLNGDFGASAPENARPGKLKPAHRNAKNNPAKAGANAGTNTPHNAGNRPANAGARSAG